MGLIEIIAVVLLVMWVGGFALNLGSFVHILLVMAVVVFLLRYLRKS